MSHSTDVRVLLVEDSDEDAFLVLRALEKQLCRPIITRLENGEKAIEFLFPEDTVMSKIALPKLILLDLDMPRVNGIEVIEKVKSDQRTKFIPIVVLTSSRQESDIIASYRLGANSYVQKPDDYHEFNQTIHEIVNYWLERNLQPN